MNTPKIRFKEFKDDWEQRKLDTVAKFSKGIGYSKGDLIETGTPIILYGRLYTKYETSISDVDTYVEAKEGSVYSKGGEVIVPASGETAEDIARAATVDKSGILLGGDLNVVMPNEDINSAFLAISISNGNSQRELAKKAQGKSVVHIHNKEIRNLIVPFPIKAEQNRIVDYFSTLDHLITLHQRKCDETKQLKKFMLQKMFPKNGEKNPEIRFKGFTDDWEQRKLIDYLDVSNEKNKKGDYKKTDVLSVSGEVGIVNQIEFQGRSFAGVSVENYGIVNAGDIVYTKSPLKANPYGIIKTNKGKVGIVSTLYAVYKPKENIDSNFVQIYFELDSRMNSYMHPLVNKGAKNDMKVSDENALKGNVTFPKINEQKAISNFITELDHLITLHQRKCEKLKELKKFMLQNMFV